MNIKNIPYYVDCNWLEIAMVKKYVRCLHWKKDDRYYPLWLIILNLASNFATVYSKHTQKLPPSPLYKIRTSFALFFTFFRYDTWRSL